MSGQEGVIVSTPGESVGPRLSIDLQSGTVYLLFCAVTDGPNKPPHYVKGMLGTIRPE